MNKNINLCEILKNVPVGTKLYSPLFGEVELFDVGQCIIVKAIYGYPSFSYDGIYCNGYPDAECLLFPSKEQRDWSKFKVEPQKVKVTLHPFDRVLCRYFDKDEWIAELLNSIDDKLFYCICGNYSMGIPYNKETANLLGTTDPCTINYEIEVSKAFIE